ncbi:MAG: carboxypeptidase regulatory-like domain-containing protein [Planctomycetes bacterium]|nr:carboxypeptidase regulatory-like domain-containing protein [Planctomycetota bacterium]
MRSRGLAFLIVAGLLGALYAVLSLQGGGGSRSHEPARPATAASEAPAPSEPEAPQAPQAPEAATPGRERVADPSPLAAERSPAASQARLQGRVVGADGSPVQGARVLLREGESPFPFLRGGRRSGRGPIQLETPEGPTAVTDAEGKFQFSGVAEGKTLSAAVEASGFLPLTAPPFTVAKGERKDVGEIRLTREGIVTGTVTDPDGHPVAGARVSIEIDPARMFRAPLLFQEEKADEQGRYRLGGLPEGKVRVLASADGWREGRSEEVDARPGATVERVDVRLLSGRAIAGRIYSRDGKPLAGAQVFAVPDEGSGPARRSFSVWRRDGVRTDASGRYELSGLAEGTYRVEAEAEGFAHGSLPAVSVGNSSADLTLDPLSRLSGRVVDGVTGKPIPSFKARAVRESFPGARFLSGAEDTDGKPDGSFEIADLEPGSYKVEVRADSFAPATAGPFAVSAGASSDAGSIAVFAGSVLRVKVVEAGNRTPIQGAEVSVSPVEKDAPLALPMRRLEHNIRVAGGGVIVGGGETESQKTGADGIAEIPGLAEGSYLVEVKAKDRATVRKETFIAAATPTDLEASLAAGGTVKGAVTRASGEPYPGARVFLASALDPDVEEQATSDADGNYQFEHVAAGEWRVGLSEDTPVRFGGGGIFIRSVRQAGAHVEERGVPVTVEEAKEAVVDLREKESGAVSGRVTESGEPVAGVRVSLTLEGQPRLPFLSEHNAESGTDGRFRIDGVPAGRYTLTAQKTGAAVPAEEEVQVAGAEAVVDIELPRGVIEGRILDAEGGRGLPGAEVRLTPQTARDTGRPRPMAISVAFTASAGPGGGGGRTTVRMGDGGDTAKTDSEGNYRLEGIPPGTYTLSATHENYADGRREGILMSRDAKVPGIDLALAQGGGIGGTVVDALGSPVPFALVEVAPKQGETKRAVAGPDGAYVVSGLAAGVYDVSARIPGPPNPNEKRAMQPGVRVEAGRKASIDLRLPN